MLTALAHCAHNQGATLAKRLQLLNLLRRVRARSPLRTPAGGRKVLCCGMNYVPSAERLVRQAVSDHPQTCNGAKLQTRACSAFVVARPSFRSVTRLFQGRTRARDGHGPPRLIADRDPCVARSYGRGAGADGEDAMSAFQNLSNERRGKDQGASSEVDVDTQRGSGRKRRQQRERRGRYQDDEDGNYQRVVERYSTFRGSDRSLGSENFSSQRRANEKRGGDSSPRPDGENRRGGGRRARGGFRGLEANQRRGGRANERRNSRGYDDYDYGGPKYGSRPDPSEGAGPPALASDKAGIRARELSGDALYGLNPVKAALAAERRQMSRLFVIKEDPKSRSAGKKSKDPEAIRKMISSADKLGVEVIYTSKHELGLLSSNQPHQGVVLEATPLQFEMLSTLPPCEEPLAVLPIIAGNSELPNAEADRRAWPLWVALDEITDPQNVGSILRSAYFLGVAGVVVCKRNSAQLTPTVSKVSAGAMEAMDVHACSSMPRFLASCSESGWNIIGADNTPDAKDLESLPCLTGPTILVLGSEGFGLRALVKNQCESFVKVSSECMGGGADVDSLNVGVCAGIMLHNLKLKSYV
eukprot:scaffold604_cov384-Prasinococcus_capsulatus_cf.AAC.27